MRRWGPMRRLVALASFVAVAGSALACGRVLDDLDEATPSDEAASSDAAPGDAPTPDAGRPDADAPSADGGACRPLVFEGFEADDWTPTAGWTLAKASADVTVVEPSRASDKALHIRLTAADGFVRLSRMLTGSCGLTVDFWMMRAGGSDDRVTVLELVGDERARSLVIENGSLRVEREGKPPLQLVSDFGEGTWHRITVRYEASGAMKVTAGTATVTLEPSDGPANPIENVSLGVLGWSGGSFPESALLFDDIRIE